MGAAFRGADLGISPENREDHANYLCSWLVVLKAGYRAIFNAGAHAERTANYPHTLQGAGKVAA